MSRIHVSDRVLLLLGAVGVGFIVFTAGMACMYFKLPGAHFFQESFESASAWMEAWEDDDTQFPSPDAIEQKLAGGVKIEQWDQAHAWNGYTLITVRFARAVYLIDMKGNIVYRWKTPAVSLPKESHIKVGANIYVDKAQLFPNGDLLLLFIGEGDTPYGYGMVKIDKDSHVIWSYNGNAHHDFYVDQTNGDIYALAQSLLKDLPKGAEYLPHPFLTDYVVKISSEGKELYRIPLLEAFIGTPYEALLYTNNNTQNKWDMFHANSVMELEPSMAKNFPLFKPGQFLVSFRNMCALAVIDPETRKVIWASNGLWRYQHSASFLPNGHLLVFDNLGQWIGNKPYARILEVDPKTLGVVWNFSGNKENRFNNHYWGRVAQLPNGNVLISQSLAGRAFEVTPDGKTVWSCILPGTFFKNDSNPKTARARLDDNLFDTKSDDIQNMQLLNAVRYTAGELPFLATSQQQ